MRDNSAYCLLSSSKAKRCASASMRMMDDDTETDRMNGVLACLCKTQWPNSWQSVYSCKFSSISSLRMIVLKRLFLTVRPHHRLSWRHLKSVSVFFRREVLLGLLLVKLHGHLDSCLKRSLTFFSHWLTVKVDLCIGSHTI